MLRSMNERTLRSKLDQMLETKKRTERVGPSSCGGYVLGTSGNPSLKCPCEGSMPELSLNGPFQHWWVSRKPPGTSVHDLPFVPGNVRLGNVPDQAPERALNSCRKQGRTTVRTRVYLTSDTHSQYKHSRSHRVASRP